MWCSSLKFKDFGWNSFVLRVPQEARLVSEGGNAKTGYMRLEAEDYFFELKWEEAQPKKLKPMPEVADTFIKKLEKDSKQKIPIQGKRSTHVSDHDALFLSLKSNLEERLYFWYCEESLRVMILRFAFKSMNMNSRRITRRLLTSLKCHGEESDLWTVFESRFKTPQSFQLTERKMMVGRTYLLLTEQKLSPFGERKREIFFEYFSMANVRFEDEYKDLDKWMKKTYFKDLKKRYRGIKFQSSAEEKLNGHDAITKKGAGRSGLTTRRSSLYTNATWYCKDWNRIYSVTVSEQVARPLPLKREIDEEAFEEFSKGFVSTIKCH